MTVTQDADVNKGEATAQDELDTLTAEIEADYASQIADLNAAAEAMTQYNADKAAYDAAMVQYNADKAAYDAAVVQYNADKAAYDAAVAEVEKHVAQEGHLQTIEPQALILRSEPNAVVSVTSDGTGEITSVGEDTTSVTLTKGGSVTSVYTNLDGSSVHGKKISKIQNTYELVEHGTNPSIAMRIFRDPTRGVSYLPHPGKTTDTTRIKVTTVLYGEDGEPLDATGALLNFGSLNNGSQPWVEGVIFETGSLLEINGSSIKNHDGWGYADANNGSGNWDTATSPRRWYGAIVGKQEQPTISYTMTTRGDTWVSHNAQGYTWFTFDSNVPVATVPEEPVEPTPPTLPVEPTNPQSAASYHYDILTRNLPFTVTYVALEGGTVDKASESVYQDATPYGSSAKANDGYTFQKWVVDKNVTLADGTVIPAGGEIAEDQIKQVVVTEDLVFTASFVKADVDEPVAPKPDDPSKPGKKQPKKQSSQKLPKAGDEAPWTGMVVAAGIALVASSVTRRRASSK